MGKLYLNKDVFYFLFLLNAFKKIFFNYLFICLHWVLVNGMWDPQWWHVNSYLWDLIA